MSIQCRYRYRRGEKRWLYCSNQVTDQDSIYCQACRKMPEVLYDHDNPPEFDPRLEQLFVDELELSIYVELDDDLLFKLCYEKGVVCIGIYNGEDPRYPLPITPNGLFHLKELGIPIE